MSSKMITELLTELAVEVLQEEEIERMREEIKRLKAELEESEAVELFMKDTDDWNERVKAHYREGKVIDGKWVNEEEEVKYCECYCEGCKSKKDNNWVGCEDCDMDCRKCGGGFKLECCKCNKIVDEDYSEYKFDGKKELYCDECKEEHLSEYCVSLKDYKEYWDEDYEYDEELEDEFMFLSVKGFDNPRDAKCEYSIMWDGDESGKRTGINSSSVFALMSCSTWECESD